GGVVPGGVLDVGDVLNVRLRGISEKCVAERIAGELTAEPERAAGLRDLEQVELRLPHRRAAADVVIPDEERDRVRELELLGERVRRVEFRIADEVVLIGREDGQAVDAVVEYDSRHLKVRRRDEGASDRDADARVETVESGAELVEAAGRQSPRV